MVSMREYSRKSDEARTASVRYTLAASVRVCYRGAILPLIGPVLQSLRGGRHHGR